MLKDGVDKQTIVDAIRVNLDERFPDIEDPDNPGVIIPHPNKLTVREYVKIIMDDLWRWAMPDIHQIVRSMVLSKSTDTDVKAKHLAEFDRYIGILERIESEFAEYE